MPSTGLVGGTGLRGVVESTAGHHRSRSVAYANYGADTFPSEGVQASDGDTAACLAVADRPVRCPFIERRVSGVDMAILSALLCIAVGNFIRSYCGNVGIWLER